MGERATPQQGKRRWRDRFALVLMSLFPLLIAGGFFTPGIVRVLALAQDLNASDRPLLIERVGRFERRPLLVPRDFSAGFIPELLDLDQLFLSSDFHGELSDQNLARVLSFPRSHGDVIVLDDTGLFEEDIVFKDILMGQQVATLLSRDFGDQLLPLCGTLYAGNCVRDDDFVGGAPVIIDTAPIPEPGSGALLALGLALLAMRRRG